MTAEPDLSRDQYRSLAEFRRQIRQFLHFSESTAKQYGIEAQQHQLLLAVHGLPEGVKPTVGEVASRLFIQHNSAVELLNRLENTGAIERHAGPHDKREVWIRLTASGRALLRKLALAHRIELERSGPELARALRSTLTPEPDRRKRLSHVGQALPPATMPKFGKKFAGQISPETGAAAGRLEKEQL